MPPRVRLYDQMVRDIAGGVISPCGLPQALEGAPVAQILTASVSVVPTLFATVRVHPSPFCSVKTASGGAGDGFDGTEWIMKRSDGHKQGQNF